MQRVVLTAQQFIYAGNFLQTFSRYEAWDIQQLELMILIEKSIECIGQRLKRL